MAKVESAISEMITPGQRVLAIHVDHIFRAKMPNVFIQRLFKFP